MSATETTTRKRRATLLWMVALLSSSNGTTNPDLVSKPDMVGGSGFEFLDPGELKDGVIRLHLVDRRPADPVKGWVPYYLFHIHSEESGHRAGEIHLRIGNTDHMRLYGGHIVYGVRPEYRGRRFAARAVRLIVPLAFRYGLSELWITCNPDNIASRRTCEAAGADFVEIVDLPPETDMYREGERQKCRYRLTLRSMSES